jgi:hypothetical protein
MGGDERIASINSVNTVLPKGVDSRTFEKAVDNLSPQDLIATSVDRKGQPNGMAPMYSDGSNVNALDISAQGKLRYVGSDTYEVYMSDGKRLVTANIDKSTGLPAPYWTRLDAQAVKTIVTRGSANAASFARDLKTAGDTGLQ